MVMRYSNADSVTNYNSPPLLSTEARPFVQPNLVFGASAGPTLRLSKCNRCCRPAKTSRNHLCTFRNSSHRLLYAVALPSVKNALFDPSQSHRLLKLTDLRCYSTSSGIGNTDLGRSPCCEQCADDSSVVAGWALVQ